MRLVIRGLLALWMRLHRVGAAIGRRRAARYTELHLTALDERTIQDIGLESWRSPLGAEVERRRQLARRSYAVRAGF